MSLLSLSSQHARQNASYVIEFVKTHGTSRGELESSPQPRRKLLITEMSQKVSRRRFNYKTSNINYLLIWVTTSLSGVSECFGRVFVKNYANIGLFKIPSDS